MQLPPGLMALTVAIAAACLFAACSSESLTVGQTAGERGGGRGVGGGAEEKGIGGPVRGRARAASEKTVSPNHSSPATAITALGVPVVKYR